MKESNGTWKFWIIVTIAININLFVVLIFVVFKMVKRLELKRQKACDEQWGHTEDATMTIGSVWIGEQMVYNTGQRVTK